MGKSSAAVITKPATPLPEGVELTRLLWRSPFPMTLQDEDFRLVDVNEAYCDFVGFARERLLGIDPIELQPEEDRFINRTARETMWQQLLAGETLPPRERRLIDADGRERWFRVAGYAVRSAAGAAQLLALLQETTAEHQARVQAERSIDELAQWFDLSPIGMLVFDEAGLIIRSNPSFEALIGQVPVTLMDAAPQLQRLLGFVGGRPLPQIQPTSPVLEGQTEWSRDDGRTLRLVARLRAYETEAGRRRYMAVVEDRSVEDERDLAQLEIGALIDAAGVGVATFDATRGWRRTTPPRRGSAARAGDDLPGTVSAPGAALQSISRELVDPASRGEYEKLQRALRGGERAQVRYAVHHPELGPRWLLTHVEPAGAGSGLSGRASSVVTLDITEQEQAKQRSDALLRELTTILDGSPAGIAYLRDGRLVRCNRRFEQMLGFAAGAVAGASFDELFMHRPAALPALPRAAEWVRQGKVFETEFEHVAAGGARSWASLSLRRAEPAHEGAEAVAVLTDITRLKASQAELEVLLKERELMFSLSEVGIAWLRDGVIERANEAMSVLTGLAPAELQGLNAAELHQGPQAAQAFDEAASQALRHSGRFSGERLLKRRDGRLRWVQVAMRAADAERPEAGLVCSFVDIDERQRARETLQLQAGRTRAMLDSVLVGIVTVGEAGIEWMNRSARRMFAGELGDFAGEPIGTVATNEPGHALKRSDWFQRLADGQSETFECRLKARDGREFWVVGNVVATTRDAAAGRQLTFALLDIEARRQAEVRIARAQASLARVIETAPLAIALFDARTAQVQQMNQRAAEFFDVLPGAGGAFSDDERAAFEASLALAGQSAEGVRREITRAHEGHARLWDTRFVSLAAAGAGPGAADDAQVLMVASDVTEQRAAEQARLSAAIEQREMLVKEVHHRIKNNLQGVAGLLQQTAQRRPEVAAALTEAVAQVQAIAQVYGLQVGGGGPLKLSGVLAAIAGSVQRSFGRVIGVDATAAAGDAWLLPEAESIPVALTINELLTNALKHSRRADGEARAVTCSLRSEGEGVVIEVVNEGQLPPGWKLQALPPGAHGLGLARALLPRRSSTLSVEQRGTQVVARIELRTPSVQRAAPAADEGSAQVLPGPASP